MDTDTSLSTAAQITTPCGCNGRGNLLMSAGKYLVAVILFLLVIFLLQMICK